MRGPLALIEAGAPSAYRVVSLRGELDVGSTPSLRDWLNRCSDGGRRSMIVDLARVEFMAVSALYVLCDEQQRMAHHRARLVVVCPDPRILQLFEICRLGEALCVVRSRTEIPLGAWAEDDATRADRLEAWLERYSETA
jgi:anti-sigma B factor antagonist